MTDAFSRESTEPGLSSCCFFNKTSGMAATKQKKWRIIFRRTYRFIIYDMWRITGNEVSGSRHRLINLMKTIYLSIQRFIADDLQARAAALTFNTLLAIVPALALVFAVAKGFGFQTIVQSQLFDYFPAQREALEQAMTFVDSYLAQTKDGIFVGVGILFLMWSVVSLLNSVETTFNDIWQVSKQRSIYRKIVDYIAIMVLLPILMIVAGGLSIFVTSGIDTKPMLAFFESCVAFCIGDKSLYFDLYRFYGFIYFGSQYEGQVLECSGIGGNMRLVVPVVAVCLYQRSGMGFSLQCHIRQFCFPAFVSVMDVDFVAHLPFRGGSFVFFPKRRKIQFR